MVAGTRVAASLRRSERSADYDVSRTVRHRSALDQRVLALARTAVHSGTAGAYESGRCYESSEVGRLAETVRCVRHARACAAGVLQRRRTRRGAALRGAGFVCGGVWGTIYEATALRSAHTRTYPSAISRRCGTYRRHWDARGSSRVRSWMSCGRTRIYEAETISTWLQHARVGLLHYPTDYLTKSGIWSSYVAHGVLPGIFSSPRSIHLIEKNKHFVRWSVGEHCSLASAGISARMLWHWYQEHACSGNAAHRFLDAMTQSAVTRCMILPNFLVIGAQKAGTTALTKFLRQHPDVCFSRPKETWFFDKRYDRGLEWFASHFEHYNGEQAIGEGTARLLQCEAAPERIANDLGNPRLICILRDPVDRAFSQYHFISRPERRILTNRSVR